MQRGKPLKRAARERKKKKECGDEGKNWLAWGKCYAPGSENTSQMMSSDDEVDYSIKPEFYDSDLDEKDEKWVQQRRKGRTSDALLSCPACFTTLCLDCQRHEKYVTQYRAMFVLNCEVKMNEIPRSQRRRPENPGGGGEIFRPVCCSVCSTEVGVLDGDQVYHLFNVLPSYS
ncbi:unnamed protein product [Spirodela intermedia]|uniref:Uncharacterized protein n=1 Tax=Spirodela intermedia TaxID=51605 RepID=A0A7I8IY11_SPIIN|nr:unnamed protein product [Spirodela intermedia]CAA6662699.1 unnamed protein product [Spirodela intermedia]